MLLCPWQWFWKSAWKGRRIRIHFIFFRIHGYYNGLCLQKPEGSILFGSHLKHMCKFLRASQQSNIARHIFAHSAHFANVISTFFGFLNVISCDVVTYVGFWNRSRDYKNVYSKLVLCCDDFSQSAWCSKSKLFLFFWFNVFLNNLIITRNKFIWYTFTIQFKPYQ